MPTALAAYLNVNADFVPVGGCGHGERQSQRGRQGCPTRLCGRDRIVAALQRRQRSDADLRDDAALRDGEAARDLRQHLQVLPETGSIGAWSVTGADALIELDQLPLERLFVRGSETRHLQLFAMHAFHVDQ